MRRSRPFAFAPLVVAAATLSLLSLTPPMASAQEIQPSFKNLEPGESAIETFELNQVAIIHHTQSGWMGFGVRHSWHPARGKYREGLDYQDFFLALGRPDLASRQAARETWSEVLFWGGTILEFGGLGVAIYGGSQGSTPLATGGVIASLSGFAASIVGSGISTPILPQDEARRYAERYNTLLRMHLSPAEVPTRGFPGVPVAGLRLRPVFGPEGAGLWATATF